MSEAQDKDILIQRLLKIIEERNASFKLRWQADMRAIKLWQGKTGETLTWPDHTDLLVWLMEELDRVRKGNRAL